MNTIPTSSPSNIITIILAAGKGKRMQSHLPKVLHQIGGKPLLAHVISAAQAVHQLPPKSHAIYVIYGEGGEQVLKQVNNSTITNVNLHWIEQKEQLGTGHAVQQVLPHLAHNLTLNHATTPTTANIPIIVLYGDVPLITPKTLQDLLSNHINHHHAITLITTKTRNPSGYGRVVRNTKNNIIAIVEDRDASNEQRQIKEINTGILCTTNNILQQYLPRLQSHNKQGEFYLTDIVALALADGHKIGNILVEDITEVSGINDLQQLAQLERYYQKRITTKLMQQGVTLRDPARLDVRGELQCAQDVVIDINVIIEGRVSIGINSVIGANCYLKNIAIGNNVEIKANCVLEGAVIEDNCVVGPFARMRPQSTVAHGTHIGNFVEIKNSTLGPNSKVNHLTYLGDAVVGKQVNVGAGTITCNYDGANKHQTIIEDGAFIGSNVSLIAPVTIGNNATIGAGSTISHVAPAEKLTLTRSAQITIDHWQKPVKNTVKDEK